MSSLDSPSGITRSLPTWKLGLLLVMFNGLSACMTTEARSPQRNDEKPAVPVVAATAIRKTMPLVFQTTGNVQAYSTIAVKSQIDGQLTGVYFREGQTVHKGDLLFTIDPRLLKASLEQASANRAKAAAQVSQAKAQRSQAQARVNQARATVAKDLAQAKLNEVQAQRYTGLLEEGAVSQEQAEQFQTSAAAQRAIVTADRSEVENTIAAVASATANIQNAQAELSAADAQVENAKVQLSYASIYAPNDGQLGTLNVDRGNLIEANATDPLVTIRQIRPIYVTFAIPQSQLSNLKKYQAQGKLMVTARSPQDSSPPAWGQLVFVDSGVDTSTGTIKLKATFPNPDGRLTPGQFVDVVLKLKEDPNVLVVPASAVQAGQQGAFIYVIKPDRTVEARPVTTGQTIKNQTAIGTGLTEGDRVVIDGQFNLSPGATVQEKETE